MKQILLATFFLAFISISAYTQSASDKKYESSSLLCDHAVEYNFVVGKILAGNNERVDSFPTQVVVNPITKVILIKSSPPNQEPVTFKMNVSSIKSCGFENKNGKADYKGELFMNESSFETTIHIKLNNGVINFSFDNKDGSPGQAVLEGYNYKVL
jgi:hypothetical protein